MHLNNIAALLQRLSYAAELLQFYYKEDFMEAIGLALCRHNDNDKNYLFRMPKYGNLNAGDKVVVETKKGEQEATVVASATVFDDEEDFNMILKASGATLPLKKVLKKVTLHDLYYEGEDFLEEELSDE